jgi:carboxymethylenebutenolidase
MSNADPTRREIVIGAGLCVMGCRPTGDRPEPARPELAQRDLALRALEDGHIVHGKVKVASGGGEIDAYLARPDRPGKLPLVIVVAGGSIEEEYIANTTALLAQHGIVGVAPDIFSLQKPAMTADEKRAVFAEQITDERIFGDLQAAVDHLRPEPFFDPARIGIMGFCFGGRCALMFAAASPAIRAVVSFYGNLRTPRFANRTIDPLDVLDVITVPVQGHYAEDDPEIPADQRARFANALKAHGTPVEIFTYPARHGFFAYTRPSYDASASRTSWQRTAAFFAKTLGGP